MTQPPGYENSAHPDNVCHLKKAIYCLLQAPKAWYDALTDSLIQMGFKMSESDNSLFVLHNLGVTIYILIYLDDIILTGSNETLLQQVITSLSKKNSLKYLVFLHYLLGIEVRSRRDVNGLFLSQSKYIHEVLDKTQMHDWKGV